MTKNIRRLLRQKTAKKGNPYITVQHQAGGKHKVVEHASKKAAHKFGQSLRAAGHTVFAHSQADAKKHGLDPRHPLADHAKAKAASRPQRSSSSEKSGVRERPKAPAKKAEAPKKSHSPVKKLDAPKFGTAKKSEKSSVKAPSRAGKKSSAPKGKVKPGLTPKEPKRQFKSKSKVSKGQRYGKIAKPKKSAAPKGSIKQKSAERKFKQPAKPGFFQKLKAIGNTKVNVKGAVERIKHELTKKRSLRKPAIGGGVSVGKRGGRFKFSKAGKKIYLHKR